MSQDIFKPIETEPIPRITLSIAEASKSMSISDRTIQTLISRGEIPTVSIGKRRLIPVDGLREWVANGCPKVNGTGDNPEGVNCDD